MGGDPPAWKRGTDMKNRFDEYFDALQGKTVGVLGLGVSNRPLTRLLLELLSHSSKCRWGPVELPVEPT